ncbi:NYN domain-containing protein [Salinispira pacifica]|uniref:Maebl n=1 Tax=Salinispira pacifica TaxID=1307761 RepID=V5WNU3_9SPIO|nr:NYN domain-containing protein [Salinispira pacifica]AHC16811.1 Maebl [Salinispira pacifica]
MEGLQKRLAVLIDADNAQPKIIEAVLEEVANYGIASVKRIYGDWTSPNLKSWKELVLQYSIQPHQQFAYTSGKNATDSALIIDAMDLLYSGNLDGFCIVSSDSDFTRLSSRLRESGMTVYGFGEKKTPESFVVACDRFIYTENLRSTKEEEAPEIKRYNSNMLKQDSRLINSIRKAIEDSEDDEGWANLGTVGMIIMNAWPQFDPRNYGYSKLGELVQKIDLFEIDPRKNPGSSGRSLYIRDRRKHK